jgi:anti-sigma B factor antagonist
MLSGELDSASATTLRCCLDSIDAGFRQVVLDLTDLMFIDSTGVGTIADAHRHGEHLMRDLVLYNPTGHVAKVIEMTGLGTVMAVTTANDTRDVAPAASGSDVMS